MQRRRTGKSTNSSQNLRLATENDFKKMRGFSMRSLSKYSSLVLGVTFLILFSTSAFAQAPNNLIDGVAEMYRDAADQWRAPILAAATKLFWLLALIDLVWNGIELALKRAGLQDAFAELVRWVLTISFFLALLQYSNVWGSAIINSFRQLGADAGTRIPGAAPGLDPSDIFDMGLRISADLVRSVSFTDIGDSLVRTFTGLVMMLLFAALAAFVLIALIEMYVVLSASIILLGFGGSRFTNDYSRKYYAHVVGVGLKLFAMQLLVGLGQAFIAKFHQGYTGTMPQAFAMCGATLVLALVIMTVPSMIQSIVTGATHGGAGAALVGGATAAAGVAAGVATGGLGTAVAGGKAIAEAAKLTSSQSSGSVLKQGAGSLAAGTLKNLASAGLSDLGAKMSGSLTHQHGRAGARMAAHMKEERLSSPPPKSAPSSSGPLYPGASPFQSSSDNNSQSKPSEGPSKPSGFNYWR
jgi:type IV secretion system protein TrbL